MQQFWDLTLQSQQLQRERSVSHSMKNKYFPLPGNNGLVRNWERNIPRLHTVTLLI